MIVLICYFRRQVVSDPAGSGRKMNGSEPLAGGVSLIPYYLE